MPPIQDEQQQQHLQKTVDSLLKKASKFKKKDKTPNRYQVLLEHYEFALALSRHIQNKQFQTEAERKIQKAIKAFVQDALHLRAGIDVSNLGSLIDGFRARLHSLRLKASNQEGELRERLQAVQMTLTDLWNDIFSAVHRMLSDGAQKCPHRHAIVALGSLATQMATPFSDLEYIIILEHHTEEEAKLYFNNFAALVELFMIAMGESPLYHANALLEEEYKSFYPYIHKGARLDEHKQPGDVNRRLLLITMVDALVRNLPSPTKLIHEPGNHTSAALMTTGRMSKESDESLYDEFQVLFQTALGSQDYLDAIKALIEQDVLVCKALAARLTTDFHETPDKPISIKTLLIPIIQLARGLQLFLAACDPSVDTTKTNVFDILDVLKAKNYLTEERYALWLTLATQLTEQRWALQLKEGRADVSLPLSALNQLPGLSIQTLVNGLETLEAVIRHHLTRQPKQTDRPSLDSMLKREEDRPKRKRETEKRNPVEAEKKTFNSMSIQKVKFALGKSDFATIIRDGYGYVDKTLFAKAILDDKAHVKLILRPRRFGKSINLSMLRYFFAINVDGKETKSLFDGSYRPLNISQEKDVMERQGQYPVIYLNLREIKGESFDIAKGHLKNKIRNLYRENREVISELAEDEKRVFEGILNMEVGETDFRVSLRELCKYLTRYHERKPIILIDEYDTPLHKAYENSYYDEMAELLSDLLGNPLKDNDNIVEQAVITGILRISKLGLFSDLNNDDVHTIKSDKRYAEFFGFNQREIDDNFPSISLSKEFRAYYGGYQIGSHSTQSVFPPWSIISFANNGLPEKYTPYWSDSGTADTSFISRLIKISTDDLRKKFSQLLNNEPINIYFKEKIVINDFNNWESLPVATQIDRLMSLLALSGYLTIDLQTVSENFDTTPLIIPNQDIHVYLKQQVGEWFPKSNFAFNSRNLQFLRRDSAYIQQQYNKIATNHLSILNTCALFNPNCIPFSVLSMLLSESKAIDFLDIKVLINLLIKEDAADYDEEHQFLSFTDHMNFFNYALKRLKDKTDQYPSLAQKLYDKLQAEFTLELLNPETYVKVQPLVESFFSVVLHVVNSHSITTLPENITNFYLKLMQYYVYCEFSAEKARRIYQWYLDWYRTHEKESYHNQYYSVNHAEMLSLYGKLQCKLNTLVDAKSAFIEAENIFAKYKHNQKQRLLNLVRLSKYYRMTFQYDLSYLTYQRAFNLSQEDSFLQPYLALESILMAVEIGLSLHCRYQINNTSFTKLDEKDEKLVLLGSIIIFQHIENTWYLYYRKENMSSQNSVMTFLINRVEITDKEHLNILKNLFPDTENMSNLFRPEIIELLRSIVKNITGGNILVSNQNPSIENLLKQTDELLGRFEKEVPENPLLSKVYVHMAELMFRLDGNDKDVRPVIEKALRKIESLRRKDHIEYAKALSTYLWVCQHNDKDRYNLSIRRIKTIYDKDYQPTQFDQNKNHIIYYGYYRLQARCYLQENMDLSKANDWFECIERLLSFYDTIDRKKDYLSQAIESNQLDQARIKQLQGFSAKASGHYLQIVKNINPNSSLAILAKTKYIELNMQRGNFAQSQKELIDLYQIAKESLGLTHWQTFLIECNLLICQCFQGQAFEFYGGIRERLSQLHAYVDKGADRLEFAEILFRLSKLYLFIGNTDFASQCAENAIEYVVKQTFKTSLTENMLDNQNMLFSSEKYGSAFVCRYRFVSAYATIAQKSLSRAYAEFDGLHEIFAKNNWLNHPDYYHGLYFLCLTKYLDGDIGQKTIDYSDQTRGISQIPIETLIAKLLSFYEKHDHQFNIRLAHVYLLQAKIQYLIGEYDVAFENLKQAEKIYANCQVKLFKLHELDALRTRILYRFSDKEAFNISARDLSGVEISNEQHLLTKISYQLVAHQLLQPMSVNSLSERLTVLKSKQIVIYKDNENTTDTLRNLRRTLKKRYHVVEKTNSLRCLNNLTQIITLSIILNYFDKAQSEIDQYLTHLKEISFSLHNKPLPDIAELPSIFLNLVYCAVMIPTQLGEFADMMHPHLDAIPDYPDILSQIKQSQCTNLAYWYVIESEKCLNDANTALQYSQTAKQLFQEQIKQSSKGLAYTLYAQFLFKEGEYEEVIKLLVSSTGQIHQIDLQSPLLSYDTAERSSLDIELKCVFDWHGYVMVGTAVQSYYTLCLSYLNLPDQDQLIVALDSARQALADAVKQSTPSSDWEIEDLHACVPNEFAYVGYYLLGCIDERLNKESAQQNFTMSIELYRRYTLKFLQTLRDCPPQVKLYAASGKHLINKLPKQATIIPFFSSADLTTSNIAISSDSLSSNKFDPDDKYFNEICTQLVELMGQTFILSTQDHATLTISHGQNSLNIEYHLNLNQSHSFHRQLDALIEIKQYFQQILSRQSVLFPLKLRVRGQQLILMFTDDALLRKFYTFIYGLRPLQERSKQYFSSISMMMSSHNQLIGLSLTDQLTFFRRQIIGLGDNNEQLEALISKFGHSISILRLFQTYLQTLSLTLESIRVEEMDDLINNFISEHPIPPVNKSLYHQFCDVIEDINDSQLPRAINYLILLDPNHIHLKHIQAIEVLNKSWDKLSQLLLDLGLLRRKKNPDSFNLSLFSQRLLQLYIKQHADIHSKDIHCDLVNIFNQLYNGFFVNRVFDFSMAIPIHRLYPLERHVNYLSKCIEAENIQLSSTHPESIYYQSDKLEQLLLLQCRAAYSYYLLGEYQIARELLEEITIPLLKKEEKKGLAFILFSKTDIEMMLGKILLALNDCESAKQIYVSIEIPKLTESRGMQQKNAFRLGRLLDAIKYSRLANVEIQQYSATPAALAYLNESDLIHNDLKKDSENYCLYEHAITIMYRGDYYFALQIGYEQLANLSKYEKALNYYQQSVDFLQTFYNKQSGYYNSAQNHPYVAEVYYRMARCYRMLSQYKKAKEAIEMAISGFNNFYQDEQHIKLIRCKLELAKVAIEQDCPVQAQTELNELRPLIHLLSNYDQLQYHYIQGKVYYLKGNLSQSSISYNKAIRRLSTLAQLETERYPIANKEADNISSLSSIDQIISSSSTYRRWIHPITSHLIYSFGKNVYKTGNFQQAITLFEEALLINLLRIDSSFKREGTNENFYETAYKLIQEKGHAKMALSLHELGNCYFRFGDYQLARNLFDRIQIIQQKNYGNVYHKEARLTRNCSARVDIKFGDFDQAFSKLEIITSEPLTKDLVCAYHIKAKAYFHQGNFKQAAESLKLAIFQLSKLINATSLPKDPLLLKLMKTAARLFQFFGYADFSRQLLLEALKLQQANYSQNHIDTSRIYLVLSHQGIINYEPYQVKENLALAGSLQQQLQVAKLSYPDSFYWHLLNTWLIVIEASHLRQQHSPNLAIEQFRTAENKYNELYNLFSQNSLTKPQYQDPDKHLEILTGRACTCLHLFQLTQEPAYRKTFLTCLTQIKVLIQTFRFYKIQSAELTHDDIKLLKEGQLLVAKYSHQRNQWYLYTLGPDEQTMVSEIKSEEQLKTVQELWSKKSQGKKLKSAIFSLTTLQEKLVLIDCYKAQLGLKTRPLIVEYNASGKIERVSHLEWLRLAVHLYSQLPFMPTRDVQLNQALAQWIDLLASFITVLDYQQDTIFSSLTFVDTLLPKGNQPAKTSLPLSIELRLMLTKYALLNKDTRKANDWLIEIKHFLDTLPRDQNNIHYIWLHLYHDLLQIEHQHITDPLLSQMLEEKLSALGIIEAEASKLQLLKNPHNMTEKYEQDYLLTECERIKILIAPNKRFNQWRQWRSPGEAFQPLDIGLNLSIHVPIPATDMIPRPKPVEHIGTVLDKTHICLIIGSSGSGKTQLAIQVANDYYADKRANSVFWLRVDSIELFYFGLYRLLKELNISRANSSFNHDELLRTVQDVLTNELAPSLLVLDGFTDSANIDIVMNLLLTPKIRQHHFVLMTARTPKDTDTLKKNVEKQLRLDAWSFNPETMESFNADEINWWEPLKKFVLKWTGKGLQSHSITSLFKITQGHPLIIKLCALVCCSQKGAFDWYYEKNLKTLLEKHQDDSLIVIQQLIQDILRKPRIPLSTQGKDYLLHLAYLDVQRLSRSLLMQILSLESDPIDEIISELAQNHLISMEDFDGELVYIMHSAIQEGLQGYLCIRQDWRYLKETCVSLIKLLEQERTVGWVLTQGQTSVLPHAVWFFSLHLPINMPADLANLGLLIAEYYLYHRRNVIKATFYLNELEKRLPEYFDLQQSDSRTLNRKSDEANLLFARHINLHAYICLLRTHYKDAEHWASNVLIVLKSLMTKGDINIHKRKYFKHPISQEYWMAKYTLCVVQTKYYHQSDSEVMFNELLRLCGDKPSEIGMVVHHEYANTLLERLEKITTKIATYHYRIQSALQSNEPEKEKFEKKLKNLQFKYDDFLIQVRSHLQTASIYHRAMYPEEAFGISNTHPCYFKIKMAEAQLSLYFGFKLQVISINETPDLGFVQARQLVAPTLIRFTVDKHSSFKLYFLNQNQAAELKLVSLTEAIINSLPTEPAIIVVSMLENRSLYESLELDQHYRLYQSDKIDKINHELFQHKPASHMDLAEVYLLVANTHYDTRQFDQAKKFAIKAIDIAERFYASTNNLFLTKAYLLLGRVHLFIGRYRHAVLHFQRALTNARQLFMESTSYEPLVLQSEKRLLTALTYAHLFSELNIKVNEIRSLQTKHESPARKIAIRRLQNTIFYNLKERFYNILAAQCTKSEMKKQLIALKNEFDRPISVDNASDQRSIYHFHGLLHYAMREYNLAIHWFKQADKVIAMDSWRVRTHCGLHQHRIALCYWRLGLFSQADEAFKETIKFYKEYYLNNGIIAHLKMAENLVRYVEFISAEEVQRDLVYTDAFPIVEMLNYAIQVFQICDCQNLDEYFFDGVEFEKLCQRYSVDFISKKRITMEHSKITEMIDKILSIKLKSEPITNFTQSSSNLLYSASSLQSNQFSILQSQNVMMNDKMITIENSLKSYRINEQNLTIDTHIGSGHFGEVFQGTYEGKPVAIKKLKVDTFSKKAQTDLEKDAMTMRALDSPCITKFYGVYESSGFHLVTEYVEKGSLYHNLKDDTLSLPWESMRYQIALDIAAGLSYLHDNHIIHRDLKSQNVLLDGNYRAKLANFGFVQIKAESRSLSSSRKAQDRESGATSVGTLRWMAPELFGLRPTYGTASDMFAFAIVLWELAARQIPFLDADELEIKSSIKDGSYTQELAKEITERFNDCPEPIVTVMKQSWQQNSKERSSAEAAFSHLESNKAGFFRSTAIDKTQISPILEAPKDVVESEIGVEEEYELQEVALASQRSVNHVQIQGQTKECKVVPTKADGNCGFTAAQHYLTIMGHKTLTDQLHRTAFIKTVVQISNEVNAITSQLAIAENQRQVLMTQLSSQTQQVSVSTQTDVLYHRLSNELSTLSETIDALMQRRDRLNAMAPLIAKILEADRAKDITEWQTIFQSSGYWLQDAHFRFLSQYYNLRFYFYYVGDDNQFAPEPSYEAIDESHHDASTIDIHLAHLSMQLKGHPDARLNHFEALLIEPTDEQNQQMDAMANTPTARPRYMSN